MELLASLGLNQTVVYQFIIFAVAFLIVNNLISKPYHQAYEERKKRTTGSADQAGALLAESQKLEEDYSVRAREINEQIRSIYEQSRKETVTEQTQILVEAQKNTKEYLDQAQNQIQNEMDKAREQIKPHVSEVAEAISSHMLGR